MTDEQKAAVIAAAKEHLVYVNPGWSTPEKLVSDAHMAVLVGIRSRAVKAVLEAAGEEVPWEPTTTHSLDTPYG